MHQAFHARLLAGFAQTLRQIHMHLFEGLGAAMQDGHEVDHCVYAPHQTREVSVHMHVRTHHFHRGQKTNRRGPVRPAAGHHDAATGAAGLFHQFFAQAAAYKTAAT